MEDQPTSLSTALKRPLLVLVVLLVAAAFLNPPYLVSVLLFIVSALSFGASPSITNTSFTPMSVRDDTLKNKFLHTEVKVLHISIQANITRTFKMRHITLRLPQVGLGNSPHHRLDMLGLAHPQTQVNCQRLSAQTVQRHRLTNRLHDGPQVVDSHNFHHNAFSPF